MPSNDTHLRQLAAWVPQWKVLDPIEDEIATLWQRLKTLRTVASETRAALIKSSPVTLTELEIRFWSKVAIVDDDKSCWDWTGSTRPVRGEEYGQFKWENPVTAKTESTGAHRVSFFLTNGCLPNHARHTCDRPICVRPSHLLDGTHQDNMRDRRERGKYGGRLQVGELNDSFVLTDEIVIEARQMAAEGATHTDLAEHFGKQRATLSYAITGRTWSHLDAIAAPVEPRRGGGKLTRVQIEEIRATRAAGETTVSLGATYGVTPSAISYLTRDKTKPPRKQVRRNLTDDQVRDIRERRGRNVPLKDLAAEYEVSVGLISQIQHRRAYGHVSAYSP